MVITLVITNFVYNDSDIMSVFVMYVIYIYKFFFLCSLKFKVEVSCQLKIRYLYISRL